MKEKFLAGAEIVDAWRVVPRSILVAYGYLAWHVVNWFMILPEPTSEQTFLVTTITGLSAAVIALYQNSGRVWGVSK